MFKVGDRVKMINSCPGTNGWIGTIEEDDGTEIPYKVVFSNGGCEWNRSSAFEKVEEEKVMEFKVGDKVRVSNSWECRSGEVGEIVRVTERWDYKYTVSFDDEFEESFKEEEIELVKEKQSFTKSDLKTGMGVVLRDGSRGHVLLDTNAGDVIRFINRENNEWMSTLDYDSEMRDSDMKSLDIMGVYSSRLACCYVTERLFTASNQVFKREEPKPEPTKMTMKEINEHFGKAIEIVE